MMMGLALLCHWVQKLSSSAKRLLVMARRLVAVRCAARGDRTDFGWRGQFQQHCDATLLFKHGVSDTSLALLRAEQFHGRAPVQRLPEDQSAAQSFFVSM